MGNKNINQKTSKGTNISTVGVDIGDWVYEKKIRGNSQYGPVMFRTWDFGGQNEYYATHQYFLSKRSLYIVVWKITDGHRGIAEILQWLVNIQVNLIKLTFDALSLILYLTGSCTKFSCNNCWYTL